MVNGCNIGSRENNSVAVMWDKQCILSDKVATGLRIGGADTLSTATTIFVVIYLSSDQSYTILSILNLDIPATVTSIVCEKYTTWKEL